MSDVSYTNALIRSPIAGPYPVTSVWQQFFRDLFERVGGPQAPTITEINNIVVQAVIPDFELGPRVESGAAPSGGLQAGDLALGVLSPRSEATVPGLGLEPRVELVESSFDLGTLTWP